MIFIWMASFFKETGGRTAFQIQDSFDLVKLNILKHLYPFPPKGYNFLLHQIFLMDQLKLQLFYFPDFQSYKDIAPALPFFQPHYNLYYIFYS